VSNRWSTGPAMALCALSLTAAWAQEPAWQTLGEPAEGPFVVSGTLTVADPAALDLKVRFGGEGPQATGYYLAEVTPAGAVVSRVSGDTVSVMAGAEPLPAMEAGHVVPFRLFRDRWRIALIWGGRVVAKCYDSSYCGPDVAYSLTPAPSRTRTASTSSS